MTPEGTQVTLPAVSRPGRCDCEDIIGAFVCGAPASWHGVRLEGSTYLGWEACDPHLLFLANEAQWTHPRTPACDAPDGWFLIVDNRCISDVDMMMELDRKEGVAGE